MTYIVGQKVRLVDEGKVYDTYYNWAIDNKLSMSDDKVRTLWIRYLATEENNCKDGTELTIIATGCHGNDRCINMYLCEDLKGNPVLVCERGLTPVEEKAGLKWTDLKIGDVLRKRLKSVNGYRIALVTCIDTYDTTGHIQLANEWYKDEDLDAWEKVDDTPPDSDMWPFSTL